MLISFRAETFKVAWKEALAAFKPANLGLLLIVSLRALRDLYKALFFAWFIPTALLAGLVLDVKSLIYAFYLTLLARAARPSIDLKRFHYWKEINFVDWVLFTGMLLGIVVIRPLLHRAGAIFEYTYKYLLKAFFLGDNFSWLPGSSLLGGTVIYFLSPFIIIWVFFMLDSKESAGGYIKAFGRSILMMLYNYPFFLISYLALRILIAGSFLLGQFFLASYPYLPHIGWGLLFGFLIPFYLCFIMSFYVKRIHEQFGLYYRS